MALISGLLSSQVVPSLNQAFASNQFALWATNFLTSGTLFAILFTSGEYIIRKKLWRIEVPELDFSGIWDGKGIYENVEGEVQSMGPLSIQLNLMQDCLSCKLSPMAAEPYAVNWGSIALEIDTENEKISYAYYINYSSPYFPCQKVKGLEELRVTGRDEKNRPQMLSGTFSHCALGQKPLYKGKVRYNRLHVEK